MKIILTVLGLVVVLGVLYGLAFLGVIPVQKMAAKNPAMAKALAKMHLAPAKPKAAVAAKTAATAPADPQQQALQTQQKQLAADRAQLDKDRTAFEAEKQQPPTPAGGTISATSDGGTAAPGDLNAKLTAIYATMSPDDIAKIFAKLPDSVVIQNLTPLDERQAGKVLAAMPPDRAARLSQLMMAQGVAQQASAVPTQPQTSLP